MVQLQEDVHVTVAGIRSAHSAVEALAEGRLGHDRILLLFPSERSTYNNKNDIINLASCVSKERPFYTMALQQNMCSIYSSSKKQDLKKGLSGFWRGMRKSRFMYYD